MNKALDRLNALPAADAQAEFLKCCGSTAWAERMGSARPFATVEALFGNADEVWWLLTEADWLEAFRAHPKIGEKKAEATQSAQAESWSAQEQSSIANASSQTVDQLAELNREYADRFGFIFIVCATGKSSEEMLEILKTRLRNEPADEIRVAAEEQRKITRLRLEKLLQSN